MKNLKNWLTRNGFSFEICKGTEVPEIAFINVNITDKEAVKKIQTYLKRYKFTFEFRANYTSIMAYKEDKENTYKSIDDTLIQATIKDNKINDLNVEVAATEETKENKKINTLYTIQDELQNNNYDTDISTSILSVNKKCRFNKTYRNFTIYISDNGIHEFNLWIFEGDILKGESIKKYLGKNIKYHDVFKIVYDYTNIDIVEEESNYNDYAYSYNNNTYEVSISLDGKLFINDNVKYEFTAYDKEEYAKLIYNYEYRYNLICKLIKEGTTAEENESKLQMNLQALASKQLKPIYNDDIKWHKEYQLQQLQIYNSNVLNFNKRRINNKMIEEYTKYFVYNDNTFMSVPPAKDGSYPGGYYEHVRNYNYKIDIVNKVILFTDKEV
ncbi:MAG: hypothetical protein ACRC18_07040 [Cetobacterium sp.]